MKEEEQRIAIAEACGFDITPLNNSVGHLDRFPDYLNDLDAMHEVVQPYLYEQAFWNVFTGHLKVMDKECEGWNTTASQRAEAFLKTLNLWKD